MTNWKKKQFEKKKLQERNMYAKELFQNRSKYRRRVVESIRFGDEEFSKAKVLKGFDEEEW